MVVAGNSICLPDEELFQDHSSVILCVPYLLTSDQRFTKREAVDITISTRELDLNLLSIARSCPVDIMPGDRDPSNYFLPQSPLNKCLLRSSSKLHTLTLSTNPHSFELEGIKYVTNNTLINQM